MLLHGGPRPAAPDALLPPAPPPGRGAQLALLAAQNAARSRCGAPPLRLSAELALIAQSCAEAAAAGQQQRPRRTAAGEPVGVLLWAAPGARREAPPSELFLRATEAWEASAADYVRAGGGLAGMRACAGNFTQLVWRPTRESGGGSAGSVVAVAYTPRGNEEREGIIRVCVQTPSTGSARTGGGQGRGRGPQAAEPQQLDSGGPAAHDGNGQSRDELMQRADRLEVALRAVRRRLSGGDAGGGRRRSSSAGARGRHAAAAAGTAAIGAATAPAPLPAEPPTSAAQQPAPAPPVQQQCSGESEGDELQRLRDENTALRRQITTLSRALSLRSRLSGAALGDPEGPEPPLARRSSGSAETDRRAAAASPCAAVPDGGPPAAALPAADGSALRATEALRLVSQGGALGCEALVSLLATLLKGKPEVVAAVRRAPPPQAAAVSPWLGWGASDDCDEAPPSPERTRDAAARLLALAWAAAAPPPAADGAAPPQRADGSELEIQQVEAESQALAETSGLSQGLGQTVTRGLSAQPSAAARLPAERSGSGVSDEVSAALAEVAALCSGGTPDGAPCSGGSWALAVPTALSDPEICLACASTGARSPSPEVADALAETAAFCSGRAARGFDPEVAAALEELHGLCQISTRSRQRRRLRRRLEAEAAPLTELDTETDAQSTARQP
eukprot:TRINITY_DN22559_c0_g1_i1.p1 TRINITY_DN22559_c0_g1~~TRINITY_DN22559_c0_g1_i1.p1  ORF type:complete len:705 (+),score=190.29 TRINITY_DN22559_c0_g1_i1:85-2115(+)